MCHYSTADLLTHHPFVLDKEAKPIPYSRVDWWDHPPGIDVVVGKRYSLRELNLNVAQL